MWKKYQPAFILSIVLCIAVLALYPWCQYYVDPDGTAYLTIAKRYATGDTLRAVNGYWSPWACWLTAGLIKCGIAAIPASIVVNIMAAIGYQTITQSLFLKFDVHRRMQWMLQCALVIFLAYAVYAQSFDDLWECFFLLCTVRLFLANRFVNTPGLWIAAGAIGALAYFSKAYSFPFFILNTGGCLWFITREKQNWLKITAVCIVSMIVFSFPWIAALHYKYGLWTTGTAGTLNLSWYLVGHPIWKDGINVLIPPVYPDSPYYWEDPFIANGATPHAWNSLKLAGLQLVKLIYNGLKLVISLAQLSFAAPLAIILAFAIVKSEQMKRFFTEETKVLAISILLFPVGYLLINFESRYLWYILPLCMTIGAKAIEHPIFNFNLPQMLVAYLLPISIAVYPLTQLPSMMNNGKAEYEVATALKRNGISGSFAGTAHARTMSKLAYFSGSAYYNIPATDSVRNKDLLTDLRRYKVKYYLDFTGSKFKPAAFKAEVPTDENGRTFSTIPIKGAENVRVYLINP